MLRRQAGWRLYFAVFAVAVAPWISCSTTARAEDDKTKFERAEKAVSLLQQVCLSNYQASAGLNINADVGSLKKIFTAGIKGNVSAKAVAEQVRGAVDFIDEKLKKDQNDAIRACMAPYIKEIVDSVLVSSSRPLIRLRFKYAFAADPATDSYFLLDRLYLQVSSTPQFTSLDDIILRQPDGWFSEGIEMPKTAETLEAWMYRQVKEGVNVVGKAPNTHVCFTAKNPAPTGTDQRLSRLLCQESVGCEFDNLDGKWLSQCPAQSKSGFLSPSRLISTAHAQTAPSRAWWVPSVDNLDERWQSGDLIGTGFTLFSVISDNLTRYEADAYTYAVSVNGTPVLIDGLPPQTVVQKLKPDLTAPRVKSFYFQRAVNIPDQARTAAPGRVQLLFGLQNLNFAGVNGGCDAIAITIRLYRNGQPLDRQFSIARPYVALRDAPLEEQTTDGAEFAWQGWYVRPNRTYDREVFIKSLEVKSTADRGEMDRARETMKQLKRDFDRLEAYSSGERLVGVIRPPLSNNAFGLAVGLVEPSQQIRFTFDTQTASRLKADVLDLRKRADAQRVIEPSTFVYTVNKATESPPGVCAAPPRGI